MEQFNSLNNEVANGFTNFETARERWMNGFYEGYAINPFSMRRVKIIENESFIYLKRFDDMPPIRINRMQLVTFPFDESKQFKFTKWFYHCLRSGKRMPFYENITKPLIKKPIKHKKKCSYNIKKFIVDDGYSEIDTDYCPYN